MRLIAIALLSLCLVSSGAFAGQARSGLLEPGMLETLSGRVDVVNQGQTMVMKLAAGSGDRWFRVETDSLTPLPKSFSASAEVFHWQGHLLLMVPQEKRALFFSIRDFRSALPLAPTKQEDLGPVRDAAALDSLLAGYEVTRIPTATLIASAQGPRALPSISIGDRDLRNKVFYPPPNPDGGLGTCGTSCSTNCADGSSCTASCASPRCAKCSCPASCTCSF